MVKVEDVVAGVSLFIVTAELRHPHASSSPHIAYVGYGLVGLRVVRRRRGTVLSTAINGCASASCTQRPNCNCIAL